MINTNARSEMRKYKKHLYTGNQHYQKYNSYENVKLMININALIIKQRHTKDNLHNKAICYNSNNLYDKS